jgi:hypothetical protein
MVAFIFCEVCPAIWEPKGVEIIFQWLLLWLHQASMYLSVLALFLHPLQHPQQILQQHASL